MFDDNSEPGDIDWFTQGIALPYREREPTRRAVQLKLAAGKRVICLPWTRILIACCACS